MASGDVCANGDACKVDGDCASAHCVTLQCVAVSCTDGIQNGQETDVDCGGGMPMACPSCDLGKSCHVGTDCAVPASGVCSMGMCIGPRCDDGVLNGLETDVDCGGMVCDTQSPAKTCADKKMCKLGSDCMSGVCVAPSGMSMGPSTCASGSCTMPEPV